MRNLEHKTQHHRRETTVALLIISVCSCTQLCRRLELPPFSGVNNPALSWMGKYVNICEKCVCVCVRTIISSSMAMQLQTKGGEAAL